MKTNSMARQQTKQKGGSGIWIVRKGEGEIERRNGLAKDCGEKGKRWWKEGTEKQCAWDSNTTRADEDDRALVCHSKCPSFDDSKAVVIGDMDAGKREKEENDHSFAYWPSGWPVDI